MKVRLVRQRVVSGERVRVLSETGEGEVGG